MRKSSFAQQAAQVHSFFDDEKDTLPKFWPKDQQIKSTKDLTPTLGHFFFKKSNKRPGEVKRVFVCLFSSYLIMSKVKTLSFYGVPTPFRQKSGTGSTNAWISQNISSP